MSKRIIASQDVVQAKSWNYPFMETATPCDDGRTNALNKRSDWKWEPPEEVEELTPPTAEEIEAIRSAAYQDGLAQGQAEGLQQGLEEGREKGYKEGLVNGQEEGYQQGVQSGEEEVNKLIAQWQALMTNLHAPVGRVEQQLEKELVLLAVSLARAVIRSEIKTNHEIIFQALSEGLKALPVQENRYQIHLHPEDITLIKTRFDQEEIDRQKWVLVEAPNMTRGGCDLVTENNAVDLSIERRVRDVLDKFLLEQGLAQLDTLYAKVS